MSAALQQHIVCCLSSTSLAFSRKLYEHFATVQRRHDAKRAETDETVTERVTVSNGLLMFGPDSSSYYFFSLPNSTLHYDQLTPSMMIILTARVVYDNGQVIAKQLASGQPIGQ